MAEVTTDQLVDTFIRIRASRAAMKAEFDAADEKLKQDMRRVENELLRRATAENLTSFATNSGTAYRREEQHASIADPDAFRTFLSGADDPFGYFEQRLSLSRIKEHMKEHDGNAPPGVHIFREFRMGVRKKKGQNDDSRSDA